MLIRIKTLPSMKPTSISFESYSTGDFRNLVALLMPLLMVSVTSERGAGFNFLTGSLRMASGVGLLVSMPSSESSPSKRRLLGRIGGRCGSVDVKWELDIPKPKLSA